MKIIDVHIHYSKIASFQSTAENISNVDYSFEGLRKEFRESNIVLGIAMGLSETNINGFPDYHAQTPMGIDLDERLPKTIALCPGINPYCLSNEALSKLEKQLSTNRVVGIKIYLGYYPFYAYDSVYGPIYELAKAYKLPIVFHTGDTYSNRGLLKYAHPLTLDEVAVEHREINFMMAHFGDPWVLDGAEVVYKNENMYADLSGLLVGTSKTIKKHQKTNFLDHLLHAITYCDSYEKLLFGTDWPLVSQKSYIELMKEIIPEEHHVSFFYENACRVFPKLEKLLS